MGLSYNQVVYVPQDSVARILPVTEEMKASLTVDGFFKGRLQLKEQKSWWV